MDRSQFFKLVTVASWVWVSQGNPVRAEPIGLADRDRNGCQILSLTGGEFIPNSNPPTSLTGVFSIVVKCGSSRNLRIDLGQTTLHNAQTKIQFVGGTGIFAGATTAPALDSIVIPITSTQSSTGDRGNIRVDVVAPSGKLLEAANDYRLVLNAHLDP